MSHDKFRKIREEEFPLTKKYAYLDTATSGVFSTRGKNAMVNFIENRYAEGLDMEDYLDKWRYAESLRHTVAEVINSDSDEIFFSNSGSDMLNVFSNGIELKEDANVVTSDLSFPSTPYNWINRVGEKNVKIVASENGQLSSEKLIKAVDKNTAVIALCLVENTSGFYHDIQVIGEFCKKREIYLVLDVTQCIGAVKIDVKNTHIDFLVATSYKWLCGLFGIAFSYVSKRVLDKVHPTYVGWTGNKDKLNHSRYQIDFANGAKRFETGNLNWIGLKSIGESMQIYLELGKDDVEEYILGLTEYLYEEVSKLREVQLVGPFPKKNRSGITFVTFPEEWKLNDRAIKENGIRVHIASETTIRIALHFYNNREDIDKLISFLKAKQK